MLTNLESSMPSLEYRGIGIRFVAVFIDAVVLFAVGYLIAIPTGMTTGTGFDLQGAPAFLWFLIGIAYYIVLEAQYGQTIGKRAVGIKVVTEAGDSLDYQASIIRNVLRIVDALPVFYLIGAISIYLSDEQQRVGDRIGDTVVVSA